MLWHHLHHHWNQELPSETNDEKQEIQNLHKAWLLSVHLCRTIYEWVLLRQAEVDGNASLKWMGMLFRCCVSLPQISLKFPFRNSPKSSAVHLCCPMDASPRGPGKQRAPLCVGRKHQPYTGTSRTWQQFGEPHSSLVWAPLVHQDASPSPPSPTLPPCFQ